LARYEAKEKALSEIVEKRQKRVPAKKPVKESALDPDRKA
jgi:hypothetical protein